MVVGASGSKRDNFSKYLDIEKQITSPMIKNFINRINQLRAASYHKKLEKKLFPERAKFYQQFIAPNDVVFDIGANMGNRVNVFLKLGARVIAVEPQPQCIHHLKQSFGDRISIVEAGVASKEGTAEMFVSSESTISTLSQEFIQTTGEGRFKQYAWNEKITIQLTTLTQLIATYGMPSFCKIDVEGFEVEVLKGLQQSIPVLSFEYCVPEMQQNVLDCLKELNRINPDGVFNYCVAEDMRFVMEQWLSYDSFLEVVNSREFAATLFGDIYFKTINN